MKFMPVIFTVAISAALALTGCNSSTAPAAPSYVPATITTPSEISTPTPAAPSPAAPMDHITAPTPAPAAAPAPANLPTETLVKFTSPKKSAVTLAVKSTPTSAPRCEEDQPCWDCHTMGNKICGPVNTSDTPDSQWAYDCDTLGYTLCHGPNIGDAWESFDALPTPPIFNDTMVIAYEKTVHVAPRKVSGVIVVKSINLPNTWHIFRYTH